MKRNRTHYRENAFRTKFVNASKHLGAAPDQIISLKIRDMVASYSEYHDMLRILDHEAGIKWSPVKDDLQGKGHHRLILLSPSSENIWKNISKYWVGDICRFCDILIIPCGLESGISTLESAFKD
jgi:hypothetical protein